MANKVIETILNRVSCRSYSDKKVPLTKLNQILEAGKYAPSAVNRQIANILAIRKSSMVEKLREISINVSGRDCMYGANTVVLVHAPREDKFCIQDSSCILENMFVAATSLKINSCWINQFDDLFNTPEGMKFKKKLGIPDNAMIVGACILGYKKDDQEIKVKPRKEDFIKII